MWRVIQRLLRWPQLAEKTVKKSDSWCAKVVSKNGTVVSGGAARNVRIAALGGQDCILEEVVRDTLARAEAAIAAQREGKKKKLSHLRLVSNG